MWIKSITKFIESSQDNGDIKRANAVNMPLCGYSHGAIMPILGISSCFISKWKKSFFQMGLKV
jgi:putative transposase